MQDNPNSLTIYATRGTPRSRYIFDHVFKKYLGVDFHVTDELDKFENLSSPCLAYDRNYSGNKPQIFPHTLLQESGVRDLVPRVIRYRSLPALFPVDKGILPFDIFAASFFLLSRYEEYLPHDTDIHGRFLPENSILYKEDCLNMPLVDHWLEIFKEHLLSLYPHLQFRKLQFQYQPTLDIDSAWKYLNKGITRTIAALARDIVLLRPATFKERFSVITGKRSDPFDVYGTIEGINSQYNHGAIIFLLMGDYGKQDRNYHKGTRDFEQLVKRLGKKYRLGIHPSYKSNFKPALLNKEKAFLESIIQKQVMDSRQHYLMLSIPYTYMQLIDAGIKRDYSMGYASRVGFRAGTSHSFKFYSLHLEEEMDLEIYPFSVMDRTLKDYLKLEPDGAMEQVKELIKSLSGIGGCFTSLWHNEAFSDAGEWTGWGKFYSEMLKLAMEHEGK